MRIDLNADLGEGFGPWTLGDDAAMAAGFAVAPYRPGWRLPSSEPIGRGAVGPAPRSLRQP